MFDHLNGRVHMANQNGLQKLQKIQEIRCSKGYNLQVLKKIEQNGNCDGKSGSEIGKSKDFMANINELPSLQKI